MGYPEDRDRAEKRLDELAEAGDGEAGDGEAGDIDEEAVVDD